MRVNAVNAHGVPTSPRRQQKWPTRRTYAALAAACAAFAAYGSLVPLQFHRVPLDEAVELFLEIRDLDLFGGSRTDLASNVLLFIPLGFFFMGALRADRCRILGWLGSAVAILVVGVALSVAIEFAQIFVALRNPSVRDVLAQTAGSFAGIVSWSILGPALTDALRLISAPDTGHRPLMTRLLALYGVGFVMTQLLPLDITISLGELAQKHREGRILLVPFSHAHPTLFDLFWVRGWDVLLYAPLGGLAALVGAPPRTHRPAATAVSLGVGLVVMVEAAQLFVFSRYTDATDVLTGSASIALGVFVATRLVGRPAASAGGTVGAVSLLALAGALAWTLALCAYHWSPFDFTLEREMVKTRLPELLGVPFRNYQETSIFHAMTEFLRKLLLAAPLGALFRLAWHPSQHRSFATLQTAALIGMGAAVLAAIEVGQMLLPSRVPDVTDVLVGTSGVIIGLQVTSALTRPRRARSRTAPERSSARNERELEISRAGTRGV